MPAEKRISIPGSHRELVAGSSAARPLAKNEPVQATVVLRRRSHTQMPAAPEELASPHPRTARLCTRDEFGMIHGADPSDIAAIEAFAHEHSLTVTRRSAARRSVVLSGTA